MMSQNLKPTVLTLSVLTVMSAHSTFAADIDKNLSNALGYGENERALASQTGGSAIFDELGEELANAVVLDELNARNDFVVQSQLNRHNALNELNSRVSPQVVRDTLGFQPLQIEGTLSSIYDFVPQQENDAFLAKVDLPDDIDSKKIIYASAAHEGVSQHTLEASSIVVNDNPFAHMSTDDAVALLEKQADKDPLLSTNVSHAKIAVESIIPSEDVLFSPETILNGKEDLVVQNRNDIHVNGLVSELGYASQTISDSVINEPAVSIQNSSSLDATSAAVYVDESSALLTAATDTSDIVNSAATDVVENNIEATSTNTVTNTSVESASEPVETVAANEVQSQAEQQQETAVEMAENANANVNNSVASSVEVASTAAPTSQVSEPVVSQPVKTPSMVPPAKPVSASDVLKQKDDDATSEKSLEEVFTASEKRYSLLKQGNWGLNYDARYSYYRDSRIDIATRENSSDILRFRVEEDAQHTLTNSFNVQYGLKDNLTLSADLPIVAKTDLGKDTSTVGLGDITLGARWEPFPLEKDRLPLIFNGNVTLPTGESPYNIDRDKGLSTGRGYYGIGGGVSTRKYIDPVVLFGSASLNYGFEQDGLDQKLGGDRTLVAVRPNLGAGIALGFAYSLNYDVSLTMSYQQSFSVGSEFTRRGLNKDNQLVEEEVASADQTSAILNMALGVRVSPKTIVNTSIGIGLTEDTPDVSFGVSFPLDFAGFGKK